MFFFEKKNQKTSLHFAPVAPRHRGQRMKSFFASFCSQKEVLA
jgi:hypothetical protein